MSMDERMDKQNVIYTIDYLSVLKRKEIFIHATWMNREDIMLNKISLSKKPIHKILCKFKEGERSTVVASG